MSWFSVAEIKLVAVIFVVSGLLQFRHTPALAGSKPPCLMTGAKITLGMSLHNPLNRANKYVLQLQRAFRLAFGFTFYNLWGHEASHALAIIVLLTHITEIAITIVCLAGGIGAALALLVFFSYRCVLKKS